MRIRALEPAEKSAPLPLPTLVTKNVMLAC